MTGPEHYQAAERLLDFAATLEIGAPREPGVIAEAQVHATLALAGAWQDFCKTAGVYAGKPPEVQP